MDTVAIIAALDDEIATLEKVKSLLSTEKGAAAAVSFPFGVRRTRRKRILSKEARAKIAAAQKKRWAKQKAALRASEK
jgi:hypothetical protein